jgi:hypothetical protein
MTWIFMHTLHENASAAFASRRFELNPSIAGDSGRLADISASFFDAGP